MHIPKLSKYTMVEKGVQVENTLAAVLNLDINSEVRQRFNGFYIPIHGGFIAQRPLERRVRPRE